MYRWDKHCLDAFTESENRNNYEQLKSHHLSKAKKEATTALSASLNKINVAALTHIFWHHI